MSLKGTMVNPTQGSAPTSVYLEVQQLYADQAHAIDEGRARRWAQTFLVDGVFHSPTYGPPITGAAALEAFAREVHAGLGDAVQRHYPSNLTVRQIDVDAVEARCYVLMVLTPLGEPPRITRSVTFVDNLARTPEGWRVSRRTVAVDGRRDAMEAR